MIEVTRQGRGPRMLGMMGVILACALGFGAIKSPTSFGGQAIVICTGAILTVATLGAILCTPNSFWAGMAVVGWASMFLATDLWVDRDGNSYLLAAAIYQSSDPAGFQESLHRFDFGWPQFRKTVYTQLAVAQGIFGGLVASIFVRRTKRGGNLVTKIGQLPLALILALGGLGSAYLGLRFPESLWSVVAVQVVTISLFAFMIGSVVGDYRTFCRGAAAAGWIGFAVVFSAHSAQTNYRNSPRADLPSIVYTTLYPQVLEDNWVTTPSHSNLQPDIYALVVGEPHGVLRPVATPMAFQRWPAFGLGADWYFEGHFRRFAVVVNHLAILIAGLAGGLGAIGFASWLRRKGLS
jgi:hypothetical protein